MGINLLCVAAAVGAVAGVILLFALDSLVTGLLFIVASMLFVVTAMNLKKKK